MKTLYFDSSYLFRLYSTEVGAAEVQNLAGGCETISSAWHARAELSSILLRKRRETHLPVADVVEIQLQINEDRGSGFLAFLPVSESVLRNLESVLVSAPATTFLRAADAIHLACAAEHGFNEVYSNDRHFLAAAPLFGLRGIDVIPTP